MRRIFLSFVAITALTTGIASANNGKSTSNAEASREITEIAGGTSSRKAVRRHTSSKKTSPNNGGEALDGSKSSSSANPDPNNGSKALSGSKSTAVKEKPDANNGGEALKGSK